MNVCSEPPTKNIFSTELFKSLNGEDDISGEIKNKQKTLDWRSFTKFLIQANKLPKVADKTISFWDRVLIIEFGETFTQDLGNRIIDIEDLWLKNDEERSGVLNWMIEGLERLRKNDGFTITKSMKENILKFQQVSDPNGAFITERCVLDSESFILRTILYEEYKEYCEPLNTNSDSLRAFYKYIRELPRVKEEKKVVDGVQERVFSGINLKENVGSSQKKLNEN